jgi:hypothetical protein
LGKVTEEETKGKDRRPNIQLGRPRAYRQRTRRKTKKDRKPGKDRGRERKSGEKERGGGKWG